MRALAANDHARRMDSNYRFQRHFYDLTRKYYLLGRDQLLAGLDAKPGSQILEIGCGTGRNLIAAARRWPEAHFTGLDISAAMLETAQASIARKGLNRPINLIEADACHFTDSPQFDGRRYDRIFMSYTLSMIPAWERAIEEALSALAPGGRVHIVDFGQQEQLPHWFRNMLFAWLAKFHVTPRASLSEVLERLAAHHGHSLHFRSLYRGYAWEAVVSAA